MTTLTTDQIAEIAERDQELVDSNIHDDDMSHAEVDRRALLADRRALEAENERLRAPTTASADAWNVFLSEHSHAPEFVAVKIAEAMEALERKVDLPGQWCCPKCGFRLTQRTLHAADGSVSARDQTGERCGNCNVPLWRVAALDEVNEAYQQANRAFDMRQEAKAAQAQAETERDALKAECERLRGELHREDHAHERTIGERDAAEDAMQDLDRRTGGNGEYYASTINPDAPSTPDKMADGIADRYAALAAKCARLSSVLRKHHDRCLQGGVAGLPDGNGGYVEVDMADAYSESQLSDETAEALQP